MNDSALTEESAPFRGLHYRLPLLVLAERADAQPTSVGDAFTPGRRLTDLLFDLAAPMPELAIIGDHFSSFVTTDGQFYLDWQDAACEPRWANASAAQSSACARRVEALAPGADLAAACAECRDECEACVFVPAQGAELCELPLQLARRGLVVCNVRFPDLASIKSSAPTLTMQIGGLRSEPSAGVRIPAPVVNRVQPNVLNDLSEQGAEFTIWGEHFGAPHRRLDVLVQVGLAPCVVVQHNATSVRCTVPALAQVHVFDPGRPVVNASATVRVSLGTFGRAGGLSGAAEIFVEPRGCGAGAHRESPRSLSCARCGRGTASAGDSWPFQCEACDDHSYAAELGQAVCSACPTNAESTGTLKAALTDCGCAPGFYTRFGRPIGQPGTACSRCDLPIDLSEQCAEQDLAGDVAQECEASVCLGGLAWPWARSGPKI